MPKYYCHDHPDVLEHDAVLVDVHENEVRLDESAFYPGGGGQLPDRGKLDLGDSNFEVVDIKEVADGFWHVLSQVPEGATAGMPVRVAVNQDFRDRMRQLHTALHILNALVYREFEGALVTGVQMADDDTARIDFDLPGADNARLRGLEPKINAVIENAVPVTVEYLAADRVAAEPGIIRSRSVAPPPTEDGLIRVVDIAGVDRQACGGTHLSNTGQCPPVRIVKVENKGKHFRRVRIGLNR